MNKSRRALLGRAATYLDMAAGAIRAAVSDEQFALDNLPENLQNSERYERMENAVDCLEDALEALDETKRLVAEASA